MPPQYQSNWFMNSTGNPHWVDAIGGAGQWVGNQLAPGLFGGGPRSPQQQPPRQPGPSPQAQPQLPPPAGSPQASNWSRGVFDFGGGQQNTPGNVSFVMTTNGPQAVTGQHQFSGAPILNPDQGSGGMSLAEVQRIVNQYNGVGGGASTQLPSMAQQTVNQALNAPNPMQQAFGMNKLPVTPGVQNMAMQGGSWAPMSQPEAVPPYRQYLSEVAGIPASWSLQDPQVMMMLNDPATQQLLQAGNQFGRQFNEGFGQQTNRTAGLGSVAGQIMTGINNQQSQNLAQQGFQFATSPQQQYNQFIGALIPEMMRSGFFGNPQAALPGSAGASGNLSAPFGNLPMPSFIPGNTNGDPLSQYIRQSGGSNQQLLDILNRIGN